jgi:CO dehydrogenase nickel-insertion accessory protein CooC1
MGLIPWPWAGPKRVLLFCQRPVIRVHGRTEREYRFIVIDMEAGMEHISRGTIGKPDMILIVSDPGA